MKVHFCYNSKNDDGQNIITSTVCTYILCTLHLNQSINYLKSLITPFVLAFIFSLYFSVGSRENLLYKKMLCRHIYYCIVVTMC